jgi:NADH:ubiquinone oxidoreductase subunit 3 (subunit A)
MAVTILILAWLLTWWLGTARKKRGKLETYECGVPLLGETRQRYAPRFYLLGLIFMLFDVETAFLLPYAIVYRKLGLAAFVEVLFFVGVLGLGLVYILKRRALETD